MQKTKFNPSIIKDYIIFLDQIPGQGNLDNRISGLMRSLGAVGQPSEVFENLGGFAIRLTDQQAKRLQGLGGVKSVEANAEVFLEPPIQGSATDSNNPPPENTNPNALDTYVDSSLNNETQPWGTSAVWQTNDIRSRGNFADDTYAFIIDSGIRDNTGDLNFATSSWSRSWVRREKPFQDGNGHGTHVSGSIGALINGSGIIGVAPGAQMVSLKVFDSRGGGASYATITSAINHAVGVIEANGLDKNKVVINMSLGGSQSDSLDLAVIAAADKGITVVVAAGNDGADADGFSPAAAGNHPNVYSVSAVDSSYTMANWSNFDFNNEGEDDVDFAAPGVGVLSHYKSGLALLSGTSMAAPHVAGLKLAGGVVPGDLVKVSTPGTADPFALGIFSEPAPEEPEPPAPEEPEQPPAPEEPEPPTPEEPPSSETIWGTKGNDTLNGTDGSDIITGVSETEAAPVGRGQQDVLIGAGGADVFMLGDSRGLFYNDNNRRDLGDNDYAEIIDFQRGTDKLLLVNVDYVFTVDTDALYLYWDRNSNGRLDASKRNKDELIAVLNGVDDLTLNDIDFV